MAAPVATVTLGGADVTGDLFSWGVSWGVSAQGAGSGPAVAAAQGQLVVTASDAREAVEPVGIALNGDAVWQGIGRRQDTVEAAGVARETWQLRSADDAALRADVQMAIDVATLADACAAISTEAAIDLAAVGAVAQMPVGAISWSGPLIGLVESLGRLAGGFAAQTAAGAWRLARWSDAPTFAAPLVIGADSQPLDGQLAHRPDGWVRAAASITASSWAADAESRESLATLTLSLRPRESRLVTMTPPGDLLDAQLTAVRVVRPASNVTVSAVTPLTSGAITLQARNGLSAQPVAVQLDADGTARQRVGGGTLEIRNPGAAGSAVLKLPPWYAEPLDAAALWVSPALRNRATAPELRTTSWRSPTAAAVGADVLRRVRIIRESGDAHDGMIVGRSVAGGVDSPPRLTATTIDVRGGTLTIVEATVAVSTTTAEISVRSELAAATLHYRWRSVAAAAWTSGTIDVADGYGATLITGLAPSTDYVAEVAADDTFAAAHELAWQTGLNTVIDMLPWDGIEWRLTPSDGTPQQTGTVAAGTAGLPVGGTNSGSLAATPMPVPVYGYPYHSSFPQFAPINRASGDYSDTLPQYWRYWCMAFAVPKEGTVEARPVLVDPRIAVPWREISRAVRTHGTYNTDSYAVTLAETGTVYTWRATTPDGVETRWGTTGQWSTPSLSRTTTYRGNIGWVVQT